MVNLRSLPALALVVGLLALPATASANTNVSSLSFQGNATLLTNPGPINVTLHYACPASLTNGTIQVEVFEGALDGVSTLAPATCDGNSHSVTVTVDGLYVPGDAEGVATLVSATSSSIQGAAAADQQLAIK
jgi:hypothetical protein